MKNALTPQYEGMVQADCSSCASAEMAKHGDWLQAMQAGWFMAHPSAYSRCGNKRCPCAAHHDNICTGSNETGQVGSNYP